MVDRRLIGTILIGFALSSAVFSLILGEKADASLEILSEEWNLPETIDGINKIYRLPTGEGRYAYGLGLVAREKIKQLEIYFYTLENETATMLKEPINPAPTLWKSYLEIPETGNLSKLVMEYANSTKIRILRQNLTIPTGAGNQSGFLIDLTEPQMPSAPRDIPRRLRTVHAIILGKQDSVAQYFRGHRDFFLDRESTIIDLSIQQSNNLTKYAQRVTQQGDALPMVRAPPNGHLIFNDLETDDQIFVSFAINPAMVNSRENLLHIAIIQVNGNTFAARVNTLTRR